MSGDYKSALEAAGCTVHAMKHFSSYQGDWFAYVSYEDKELGFQTGWITGSYGSCSGCDSFEAEFGDGFVEGESNETEEAYQTRLADFGRGYLPCVNTNLIIEKLIQEAEYSNDAQEAVAWMQKVMKDVFGPVRVTGS